MKLFILAGLGVGASLMALAACGSSSSGHGTFSGDGGGGEGSVGDAAGGGDGEGGGFLSKAYVGTITAGDTVAAAKTTYSISGAFIATPDAGGATGDGGVACLGTESGSCCYVAAGALADAGTGTGDAGAATAVSAGSLSVKDGTTALANISPATDNTYAIASTNNPSVNWKPGDSLAISAAGATVDSFSGTITTVTEFAGVVPALGATAATVPIASNLAVTWTAGNGNNVRVFIDGATSKGVQVGSITCVVADSAGTVSVPSALLGKFASGDLGLITLTRTTSDQVSGQNVTVALISSTSVGGTAKFQ